MFPAETGMFAAHAGRLLAALEPILGDLERGLHAAFGLTANLASYEPSDEPGQAVRPAAVDVDEPEAGAARLVGHERPQLECRPEIVARVELFGHDRRALRAFRDHDVIDPRRRL